MSEETNPYKRIEVLEQENQELREDNKALVGFFMQIGDMLGMMKPGQKKKSMIRGLSKSIQKVALSPHKFQESAEKVVPIVEKYAVNQQNDSDGGE